MQNIEHANRTYRDCGSSLKTYQLLFSYNYFLSFAVLQKKTNYNSQEKKKLSCYEKKMQKTKFKYCLSEENEK